MIDSQRIKDKYNYLVWEDKDKFSNEIKTLFKSFDFNTLKDVPTLLFSEFSKDIIIYTLCVYLSVKNDRLLHPTVVSSKNFIDQSFLENSEKDKELANNIKYGDITFITLSQIDYANSYLENLVIDLVEFRKYNCNNKPTFIIYDIVDPKTFSEKGVNKLLTYFEKGNSQVIRLSKDVYFPSTKTTKVKPSNRRRVV